MHTVLNALSEYTYFYILKNITLYIFLLVFKIVESLQCIYKKYNSIDSFFWTKDKEVLTVIDICNIAFYSDEVCITRICDLLRTSNIHFHKGEPKFLAYEGDRNIWPVTCTKQ